MSAPDLIRTAALVVAALNGVAGAYGAVRWQAARPARGFWPLLRTAQASAVAFAVLVGIVRLSGHRPGGDLFYLYALLPLAVAVVAEQLRIAAAEAVLAARGLEQTRQAAALPEREQRALVVAVLRRELGVMASAALVVCFLALRAAGTW